MRMDLRFPLTGAILGCIAGLIVATREFRSDLQKQRDAIKQLQGMVIKDADLLKTTQAQLEK